MHTKVWRGVEPKSKTFGRPTGDSGIKRKRGEELTGKLQKLGLLAETAQYSQRFHRPMFSLKGSLRSSYMANPELREKREDKRQRMMRAEADGAPEGCAAKKVFG